MENDYRDKVNSLKTEVRKGTITWSEYRRASDNAFNVYLVNLHNSLLAGQSTYHYFYTLERR